jgi:hypothetical protein
MGEGKGGGEFDFFVRISNKKNDWRLVAILDHLLHLRIITGNDVDELRITS